MFVFNPKEVVGACICLIQCLCNGKYETICQMDGVCSKEAKMWMSAIGSDLKVLPSKLDCVGPVDNRPLTD